MNHLATRKTRAIVFAGIVAGTLDGLAAALIYFLRTGKNPLVVYRFIASGIFGQEALSGGISMPLLGIFFHYVIAISWTLLFFILCLKLSILLKNWVVSGIAFGLVVWLSMNLVILPLSRVPSTPITLSGALIGISVLMVCIGLPIAFLASRYYQSKG